MIIVINGPLGVGKSQTAQRLLELLNRAAFVDIDCIAAVKPFDHQIERDREYAYDSAAILAGHHLRHGYEVVVVTWVFETHDQLMSLRKRFIGFGEFHVFRLTCSVTELERRIRLRGNSDVESEVARGRELHALLDREAKRDALGVRIGTDDRSLNDVATTILDHVTGQSAAASDSLKR